MGSQADQTQSPLGNALSTVRGLRRMVTDQLAQLTDQTTQPVGSRISANVDGMPIVDGNCFKWRAINYDAIAKTEAFEHLDDLGKEPRR